MTQWDYGNRRTGRAGTLSNVLPLSYAIDAMQRIAASGSWTSAIGADVPVILAFTAAALLGGALTLRRRTR